VHFPVSAVAACSQVELSAWTVQVTSWLQSGIAFEWFTPTLSWTETMLFLEHEMPCTIIVIHREIEDFAQNHVVGGTVEVEPRLST